MKSGNFEIVKEKKRQGIFAMTFYDNAKYHSKSNHQKYTGASNFRRNGLSLNTARDFIGAGPSTYSSLDQSPHLIPQIGNG